MYALICTDKPGALPVRKANRPQHLEYLKSLGDTVVLAGPLPRPREMWERANLREKFAGLEIASTLDQAMERAAALVG